MQDLSHGEATLIRNIAINNGFADLDVYTKAGSKKGDNYMGVITNVLLKNEEKEMNLVLKTSHSNEEYRNTANIKEAFEREVYLYETVLPELSEFQKQHSVPYPFQGFPYYFGTHMEENVECLVMQDIRKMGYGMWNRKKAMDEAHVIAVVEEYAKLHSLSLALSEKKPEVFNEMKKKMYDIYAAGYFKEPDGLKAFVGRLMERALKVAQEHPSAAKAIEKFIPYIVDYYQNDLMDPDYHKVFVHGDCWCNNLMFLYQDEDDANKPTKTCVIDWQMSKCSSPGLDLVYFLLCSATKDILENYRQILRRYYRIFSENLKAAGCDPDVVFPFSLLERHFKHYAKYGLIMATINIQVVLCDESEAPDLLSILNIEPANVEQANQRLLDLILFLDENDLF